MARILVLLALIAAVSAVAAIEISSTVQSGSSGSSATGSFSKLPRSHPCIDGCAAMKNACLEDAVFNASNEEDEIALRTGCAKDFTSCMQRCEARFTKASSGTSKQPNTFEPVRQPRAKELNQGYGPETVLNWAGYISVNGSQPNLKRHLWYWAFESRNDPETDPLVIWLTGGPGCSSLVALFAENGPYQIQDDLSLTLNPYSWNSNATVIWIDQPVNTGYSYADPGDWGAFSEDEIANNAYYFLQGFLEQYPKYQTLPFFITGESYAGHYIPALASRVLAGNADPANLPINLQAIAIGNGLVNPEIQYQEYLPFAQVANILPASSIAIMEAGLPGCITDIQNCQQNTTVGLYNCLMATETCNLSQMMPFELSGLNVYDIRIKCAVPPLCYNFSNVDSFLAQPEVISALGVEGRTWQDCNRLVDLELVFAGDWMRNLALEVPAILASGVRVVVYSGEDDFICNWRGGQAWTHALEWPGQQAFTSATNTTWMYQGQPAGTSITAQGFTFVRVAEAGHMVPLNQPERALDLLARVISGQPFDGSEVKPAMVATETPVTVAAPAIALE